MKDKALPSYAELNRVLKKTALKLHPSQAHGLMCGLFFGSPKLQQGAWEEVVAGKKLSGKSQEVLQAVFDISARQLKEFLFEFDLLLPKDSEDLPVRAEALTLWCQGMLTGLKMAEVQIVGRKPGEVTEAINDLVEIAKMNYENVVATEEDEAAYAELVEYVRMAVIMIYQQLGNGDVAPPENVSSHLH